MPKVVKANFVKLVNTKLKTQARVGTRKLHYRYVIEGVTLDLKRKIDLNLSQRLLSMTLSRDYVWLGIFHTLCRNLFIIQV